MVVFVIFWSWHTKSSMPVRELLGEEKMNGMLASFDCVHLQGRRFVATNGIHTPGCFQGCMEDFLLFLRRLAVRAVIYLLFVCTG